MRSGACRDRCRKVAGLLEEAEDDLLAFCCFPSEPGRSCGTNPHERVNREIGGGRTDVVGIFPTTAR
jgi:putative transposase